MSSFLRVLIVVLILIPLNSLWLMTASLWNAGYPTTVSLFFNTITYLFFLTLVNTVLKRLRSRWAFSGGQQLLIYSMVTVASGINGLDMLQLIGASIAGPHTLATPENEWHELFIKYIPSWLLVSDKAVLERYSQGGSTLYAWENIAPWIEPVLIWSAFTFCLILAMIGITLLLSSRWVSEERLSYPIIQLPMHMVQPNFLTQRLMWVGFGIGAFLGAINGLHFFLPNVPTIGKPINIGQYLTEKPLNAIGWLPIAVHPFAVGLGFFIPVDLSFSCWFFYFFWKFERVFASALGLRMQGFPFIDEQTTGAYVGFALAALWMARRHLFRAFSSLQRRSDASSKGVDRFAWGALLAGCLGILFFGIRTGMGLNAILLFFGIYFLISISIGRIRAELGSPVHDLHFSGPGRMMVTLIGTRRFSPTSLTVTSLFWYFNRAYRSHPMPAILEGFKLSERSSVRPKSLAGWLIFASALAILCAFWAHLHSVYQHGAGGKLWPAYETFNRLTYRLTTSSGGEAPQIIAYSWGAIFVMLLSLIRMRFIWFPLHPVGFLVSSSWAMNPFWFSIFVSWAIKSALLRYGGLKLYRKNVPLFLGLILGEFIADSGVSIAGTLLKVRTYIWYG